MTLRQAGSAEPITVYGGALSSELDDTAEEGPTAPLPGDDDPIDLIREDEATVNQSIGLEIRRPHVDAPHRLVFDQSYVVLGRSELCDLQLPHPAVSPRHAYLQRIDDRVMCVDLGSQTGIRWNNYTKVRDWLDRGDLLSIGPYEIGLGPDGDEDRGPHETSTPRPPRVVLKVLHPTPRSGQQLLWPLRNCLSLIGRGRNCNIRVEHDSVSTAHCSVVLSSRGVWIVDLLSEAGTLINGQRVRFARLRSGNEVQIGDVLFRIMIDPEARARRTPRRDERQTSGVLAKAQAEVRAPVFRSGAEHPEALPVDLPRFEPAAMRAAAFGSEGAVSQPAAQHFSEEFVLSLMNQFAAMQMQQMNMMSEIFADMQQQYRDFIREDLSRVRELTAELQKLQAALLERNLSSAMPHAEAAPAERAASGAEAPATNGSATHKLQRPAAANGSKSGKRGGKTAGSRRRKDPLQPQPRHDRSPDADPARPPGAADASSDDQYEWLLQRISEVERERSSRWKNILQTLSGAKAER